MMKRLALAAIAALLISAPAQAQGVLPAANVWGNPTAGRAQPQPASMTAMLDAAFGATTARIVLRQASAWVSTAMSGDGSLSATGVLTIGAGAITYSKMQNVAASRLLGNATGSPASPAEIALGSTLNFSGGTTLNCTTGTAAQLGCVSPDNTTITASAGVLTAIGGSATSVTIGTTTIVSGTTTRVLYDNAGVLGEYVISGSGNVCMTTSCVMTTPNLGTPSAGTLTNATGLPISSGVSGLGTGVATALGVNVGSAGAFVTFNGALGTPSSGTLTNATGLPISTGVSGLGTGVATWLATPSSANLRSAMTDESGTGALIFANGALGTPTATSVAIGGCTIGSDALCTTGTTTLGGGTTVSGGTLTLSGNISAAAWTTNGIKLKGAAATLTDTSSTGTVATAYTSKHGGDTIAASSATTFTNYFDSYFVDPVAGSNVTLTNKWALGADSVKFGTSNQLTISNAGLMTAPGTSNFSGTFQSGGNTMTFPGVAATLAALTVEDQTLSGGANVTAKSQSTGNITVDCGARPLQFITNNGAWTITAPSNDGSCAILITNGASAATPTFSGFTVGSNTGDALNNTNTNKFILQVMRINGTSTYAIKALQ